jgi:hypothetical protein
MKQISKMMIAAVASVAFAAPAFAWDFGASGSSSATFKQKTVARQRVMLQPQLILHLAVVVLHYQVATQTVQIQLRFPILQLGTVIQVTLTNPSH